MTKLEAIEDVLFRRAHRYAEQELKQLAKEILWALENR